MTKYDPNEARKILEGSLEQRVIAYAELKYGKGNEVAAKLGNEDYRKGYEDPIQTLDKVCGKPGIIDAEFQSIDDVIEYQPKPSKLKVAAKGTLNLINKTCWYYPLVGALPGKYQQRIAKKYGDDSHNYTIANAIVEAVAGAVGVIIAPLTLRIDSVYNLYLLFFGGAGFVWQGFVRALDAFDEKIPRGSILTIVPIYATLYSIAATKAVKNGIADAYFSAYEELRAVDACCLPHKDLEVPTARIETLPQTETPARIEEQKTETIPEDLEDEPEEKKRQAL